LGLCYLDDVAQEADGKRLLNALLVFVKALKAAVVKARITLKLFSTIEHAQATDLVFRRHFTRPVLG
jgi:hypothetical protein